MPVSAALRRLLRVRDLEEEQHRLALESALSGLHALEHALELVRAAERRGRALLASSAPASDPVDRIAAGVESSSALRRTAALVPRIAAAEQQVSSLRRQYLLKRTERRQADALIHEREALDAIEADRRAQQGIDNWIASRAHRDKSSTKSSFTRPSVEDT